MRNIPVQQARAAVRALRRKCAFTYTDRSRSNNNLYVCFAYNNLDDAVAVQQALEDEVGHNGFYSWPRIKPSSYTRQQFYYVRIVCSK